MHLLSDSLLTNGGARDFTAPGNNGGGTNDWGLLLGTLNTER
jgi:hypothetical protein